MKELRTHALMLLVLLALGLCISQAAEAQSESADAMRRDGG